MFACGSNGLDNGKLVNRTGKARGALVRAPLVFGGRLGRSYEGGLRIKLTLPARLSSQKVKSITEYSSPARVATIFCASSFGVACSRESSSCL